jgi:hypothetical protein
MWTLGLLPHWGLSRDSEPPCRKQPFRAEKTKNEANLKQVRYFS